ncbi:hypothetical protein [Halococcus sp. IIIV-5B]|nr:hypothetical protein [Halococcus sp. IIIV-5B]
MRSRRYSERFGYDSFDALTMTVADFEDDISPLPNPAYSVWVDTEFTPE